VELILYSGKRCHLCDQLERLVRPYLDVLGQRKQILYKKRDIADDPVWLGAFKHRIPVLVCDGRVLLEGNPSQQEIAQTMHELG